jgi:hypothetical protein
MSRITLGISILITLSLLFSASGCTTKHVYSKSSTTTITKTVTQTVGASSTTTGATTSSTERALGNATNQIINGTGYIVIPTDGIRIKAGTTLILSWSADAVLDGYILTEMQFSSFKAILDYNKNASGGMKPYIYTAHGQGTNGSTAAKIENTDTFYGVVFYNEIPALSSKIYQAVLKTQ